MAREPGAVLFRGERRAGWSPFRVVVPDARRTEAVDPAGRSLLVMVSRAHRIGTASRVWCPERKESGTRAWSDVLLPVVVRVVHRTGRARGSAWDTSATLRIYLSWKPS
jgi:hypothetical protein